MYKAMVRSGEVYIRGFLDEVILYVASRAGTSFLFMLLPVVRWW